MAYASTVDTGQVKPFALYVGDPTLPSPQTLVANDAFFVGVYCPAHVVVSGFRTYFGSGGAGHWDAGIYDSAGTLLTHVGSTATASGLQTLTLTTPYPIAPGQYWLALWIDNATDTVAARASQIAGMEPVQRVDTGSMPSTMSGAGNTATKPYILGLLQGGWS